MKSKTFISMIVMAALSVLAVSCQKDGIQGYETGNPMPGTWYADQVEYDGLPVDFKVEITGKFEEGEGIYVAEYESQKVGRMTVTSEGEPVMAADILYCLYNSRTHTGKFVIHYDDDEDPEYLFTMNYYYDPKLDRFTAIEVYYNITFRRRK